MNQDSVLQVRTDFISRGYLFILFQWQTLISQLYTVTMSKYTISNRYQHKSIAKVQDADKLIKYTSIDLQSYTKIKLFTLKWAWKNSALLECY